MGKLERKEDAADKWLRKHDPYYTDKRNNKRKNQKNYYETPGQERRRNEMEIPISNLNTPQKVIFKEYAGTYDENGNFEL